MNALCVSDTLAQDNAADDAAEGNEASSEEGFPLQKWIGAVPQWRGTMDGVKGFQLLGAAPNQIIVDNQSDLQPIACIEAQQLDAMMLLPPVLKLRSQSIMLFIVCWPQHSLPMQLDPP